MRGVDGDTVLNGDHIYLRPMTEDDADLVVSWRNDPEIGRWLFSRERLTRESHLDWFRGSREGRLDFIICLAGSGRPIGTVTLKDIDLGNGVAECGKMIGDRTQWGKGLASEAYRLLLAFGFARLGLDCVYARCLSMNTRSIRLNKRLGFSVNRVIKDSYRRGNESYDVVEMVIQGHTRTPNHIVRS